MGTKSKLWTGFVGIAIVAGCEPSPSEKWLQECEAAEAQGKIDEAWEACTMAMSTEPASKSSDVAAAKLKKLEPEHEKLAKEKAEKKAKADKEAEERRKAELAAQAARITALREKVSFSMYGPEPDDECLAKGKPRYRRKYEGGLFSENEAVALADGCRHLFQQRSEPSPNDNIFCCPGR
jgi:recombinational DNA repair ATPase RecF